MTKEEEKEIIRVCGKDYEANDVPAYIRQRNKIQMTKREIIEEAELRDENAFSEEDRMAEELEDEEFSRRAELDAEREKEN